MTPQDVLARHVEFDCYDGCHECKYDGRDWPCDAVDQARQLLAAQERVRVLEKWCSGVMDHLTPVIEAALSAGEPWRHPDLGLSDIRGDAGRRAAAEPGGEG